MKISKALILLISLVLLLSSSVFAQDTPSAAQTAEQLRAQLRDVQAEEGELQARVQQLDWDLRPENIERYFAGTGSMRPEELREQRRRQLQNEKDRVLSSLQQLGDSRTRLESAITTADAQAYQQSAQDPVSGQLNQMLGAQCFTTIRLMLVFSALFVIVGLLLIAALIYRRKQMAA
jgi:uncharacterized protein YlxW (UPF0749 family)